MTQTIDEWARLTPETENSPMRSDKDLVNSFARTFRSDDGERVLAHLRSFTRERVLGPDVPDTVLRYVEGQRGLIAYIERQIKIAE